MPKLKKVHPKISRKPKEKLVDPKRVYWLKYLEKLKDERSKVSEKFCNNYMWNSFQIKANTDDVAVH